MIYFIQSEKGPIKIGLAKNPDKRLTELQVASPYKLILLGSMVGDKSQEVSLHQQFNKILIRGEWFSPSPDLLNFINQYAWGKTDTLWYQLCDLQPELLVLLEEAESIKDDGTAGFFCANSCWYKKGGLKEKLTHLVGWEAYYRGDNELLTTDKAYDVAYHKIYNALPDCRNCYCM